MEIVIPGVYIRSLYLCPDNRFAIFSAHNNPSKGWLFSLLMPSMNDFVCFEMEIVVLMATVAFPWLMVFSEMNLTPRGNASQYLIE